MKIMKIFFYLILLTISLVNCGSFSNRKIEKLQGNKYNFNVDYYKVKYCHLLSLKNNQYYLILSDKLRLDTSRNFIVYNLLNKKT